MRYVTGRMTEREIEQCAVITAKEVFLAYPSAKTDTIQGISFEVKRGEILGFLGPSGAGKSTMQKILTGTLRNYRGSVRVLGTEMRNRTNAYYEKIGVAFEFPAFYNRFSALENLTYAAALYAAETADPMHLLAEVGLENDAHKKIGTFSKGMKVRLGFVRALIHNPPLLFLDEPTGGLDPGNARLVKNMVSNQKRMGNTVILTTHNMHDAEELCDRVAFIVDGRIAAIDTPSALRGHRRNTQVAFRYNTNGTETGVSCALAELGASPEFQAALRSGSLRSIHSKEPTLEDVFIELTGRHLQ
jgi:fluoroquinolone transport system ATP-binding protein